MSRWPNFPRWGIPAPAARARGFPARRARRHRIAHPLRLVWLEGRPLMNGAPWASVAIRVVPEHVAAVSSLGDDPGDVGETPGEAPEIVLGGDGSGSQAGI